MDKKVAVCVRNVSFSYERIRKAKNILDDVNLTVPSGVIYGLLGPSGCGKTTLLNAITGRLKLKRNQGEIVIFGEKPSTEKSSIPGPGVGYMPQDLALHEYLTLKESLSLFAQINGVPQKELASKIKYICNLLELTKPNNLIENLSGGQQRRVSLAHALIHESPLLILDEPTVGVDPMLRRKIWSYLVTLASTRNITIIITTHYIEEAKDANIIAGMRKGKILVEEAPSTLMRTMNCNNLEICFTQICCASEMNEFSSLKYLKDNQIRENYDKESSIVISSNEAFAFHYPEGTHSHPSLYSKTKLMFQRNMIVLKRNHVLLLFQLLVPLVEIIAFCLCMGNPLTGLSMTVINEEDSNGYAQKFVNNLDLNMVFIKNHSFKNGIRSVINGESVVAIHLGANFTECFKRRIEEGFNAENDTIKCGSIATYFDLTNLQIYYSLYESLLRTFEKFMKNLLQSMGKSTAIATLPVDFSNPVEGKVETAYGEYLIPGMSMYILFSMAAAVTMLKIIQEQNSGLEGRFWVNGVTKTTLVLSHSITSVIVGVCQAAIMLVFVFYVYQLPLKGSIIIVAVIGVLQSILGLAMGFFLSSIFNRESEALFFGNGIMMAHLFVSGILWPLEGVPLLAKNVIYLLPVVMPAEAVKAIVNKGWGIGHLTVQLGLLSSVVWITLLFGIVLLRVKFSI